MAKNNAIDIDIETGGGNTYTFPSATSTLASLDLAETLTNKDLSDASNTLGSANVEAAGALMDSEVTNLAQVKAFDSTDYAAALGADDNYVTDAEKTVIGNTSGTNTGDEVDMTATEGGLVPTPPNNTSTFLRGDGTFAAPAGGSSSGTVTSVSVTTANGVSGSVADDTTTPAISLTLGAITPTTVNGLEVSLGGGSTGTNVAVGADVLGNATGSGFEGVQNTGVGSGALEANIGGRRNTANGYSALGYNTEGDSNTAIGYRALVDNTTGGENTASGESSLSSNETGSNNTAVGHASLDQNISGNKNVAIGDSAGYRETGSNTFYVNNVLQSNTTNDRAYSLLYGTFSGSAASLTGQQLTVNGDFTVNGDAAADNLSGTNTGDNATNTSSATAAQGTKADSALQARGAVNAQTGTTYTLVIGDEYLDGVRMTNASANTVTIPPNADVALPVGTKVFITQGGAGSTTIAAGAGVTINAPSTVTLAIDEQWESRVCQKTGTNEWLLI